MDKKAVIEEVVKIVRNYLSEEYKIFLFGSWAKGNAQETSDIDIGILGPMKVSQEVVMRIKGAAEAIPTLRSIDIVDLAGKSDEYKGRILGYAEVLN